MIIEGMKEINSYEALLCARLVPIALYILTEVPRHKGYSYDYIT